MARQCHPVATGSDSRRIQSRNRLCGGKADGFRVVGGESPAGPDRLTGSIRRSGDAGVFVGNPSRRIRDRLWDLLATRIGDGQAIMVEPAGNEQGWTVRTAGKDRWHPTDYDGLILSARHRTQPNENRLPAG
ncbi:type I-E CRISPR-associated endoribonuclease Cas2e [Sphaerisporangium sp. NPDC051017]|uniref:type I-E CRISPR-associated endoribonuclease Cas2e n=1 Tax=Sphaerisporangium sp. NPDC051017 TaxID=3154636 RepID=UPI003415C76F